MAGKPSCKLGGIIAGKLQCNISGHGLDVGRNIAGCLHWASEVQEPQTAGDSSPERSQIHALGSLRNGLVVGGWSGLAALAVVPRGHALVTLTSLSLLGRVLHQAGATEESATRVGGHGAANSEVGCHTFLALAERVRLRRLAAQALHCGAFRLVRAARSCINRLVALQTFALGIFLEHLVFSAQRSFALRGRQAASLGVLGLVTFGSRAESVLLYEGGISTNVCRAFCLLVAARLLVSLRGALVTLALQRFVCLENEPLAARILVASCRNGTASFSVGFLRALGPRTLASVGLQGRLVRTDIFGALGLLGATRSLLGLRALGIGAKLGLLARCDDQVPGADILARLILGTASVLILLEVSCAWESLTLLVGGSRILMATLRARHR
mmetsp:Transcript_13542/g.32752  ORF Transcript_13542/g.32752 Transcript_13542/m.32752 type:complete len:386 (+) Transcript_13542:526-1683(+)